MRMQVAALTRISAEVPEIEGSEVLHEVHRGGHGVVYRATQLTTERIVVVKLFLAGACATKMQRRRFDREAALSEAAEP